MYKLTSKYKFAIIVGILFLLLFLIVRFGCSNDSKKVFQYEKANIGEVIKTVSATGVLEIQGATPVLTTIDGILSKIYVRPEQRVTRGQILGRFDDRTISEQINRQRMKVESTQLQVLSERRRYQGKKAMFAERLISQADMEQTELAYRRAQHDNRLAVFDYNELRRRMAATRLTSPINGVVLSVDVIENAALPAGRQAFIIVPDMTKMLLIVNIDEADIGSVRRGQDVTFTVGAFPERVFAGKISNVSISPIRQSSGLVAYQSEVMSDNPELLLRPGMTAIATIVVGHRQNVLKVPNQAFIVSPHGRFISSFDSLERFVWVRQPTITDRLPVIQQSVEVGLVGDMYTEILKNLDEGDEVLVRIGN
jgi:HlyD family secretion protein